MYENDVTIPYDQQPMSKLRKLTIKMQSAYYRKITEHKPVAYWVNQRLDGYGSYITEMISFLQEQMICFDGVPLHTKITEHHRFDGHRREQEWQEHPLYGSYLFKRTPKTVWNAVLPNIDMWSPVRLNRWEIAKCDFTVEEYDHVKNMIMLIKPEMLAVLDTLTEFDFVPNVEDKDLIRVGYDYTFAKRYISGTVKVVLPGVISISIRKKIKSFRLVLTTLPNCGIINMMTLRFRIW